MELVKAKISKADLHGPLMEQVCYVPFNPNEISVEEACKALSKQQAFQDANAAAEANKTHTTLSVTLYYNTLRSLHSPLYESVDLQINKLRVFLNEHETATEQLKRIAFTWGDLCVFGILSSFRVKYMMFASDGTAVRAEVSLSIEGEHYGRQKISLENRSSELLINANSISYASVLMGLADPSTWKTSARSLGLENPFL